MQLMKTGELYQIYKKSNGISTDTRKLLPGSVFFALRGENFNGNTFAEEALRKGCLCSVVDDPSLRERKDLIFVDNTLETLQKLALYHRQKLSIPFIAITGSNGKTTTKELSHAILSRKFHVAATKGNLNNHIGVPLTILSIKDEELALIEMGANHPGEIGLLCSITEPGYGIITNIGRAHLEAFGSFEDVKKVKSELYDHLKKTDGKAFYNAGNSILKRLIKEKSVPAIPYGPHPDSLCMGRIKGRSLFIQAELDFRDGSRITVQTKLTGRYNMENILAAAALGHHLNVPVNDIASAIEEYSPSNNRSQFIKTVKNKIVLDAYNANPSSMKIAIMNFLSMNDPSEKLIILGDMLELGKYSEKEHEKIIRLLEMHNVKNVILVGKSFMKASAPRPFRTFPGTEDLARELRNEKIENCLILVKGSRGMTMEKILEFL